MISVSRKLEVNPADGSEKVRLNRQQVWEGLVRKAENAVPYVEAIEKCDIVEQKPDRLIREVVLYGEILRELILFFSQERVEFVRLSGHAKGQIKNIIEEDADDTLSLRLYTEREAAGLPGYAPTAAPPSKAPTTVTKTRRQF